MELKSSRRKFLKTVAAGVIGGEIVTGSAPAVLAKKDNDAKGFEIQKGFTVFNETTQKNMMKLARRLKEPHSSRRIISRWSLNWSRSIFSKSASTLPNID